MPYQFPPDIDQLAKEQMASGLYASEDEMLHAALRSVAESGVPPSGY